MTKPSLSPERSAIPSSISNTWDQVARVDPFGVILSSGRKPFGDWDLDEFFLTGEAEASATLNKCRELGIKLEYDRALDFGCGVGRVTRAFASRFSHCVGLDVSEEMITLARKLNGQVCNCEFIVNQSHQIPFPDQSFDFVYSVIVLQHLATRREILNWVVEFIRILRPGGAVVFQLPDKPNLRRRIQGRRRLWSLLRLLGLRERFLYENLGLTPIGMNGIPADQVQRFLENAGAEVIRVEEDEKAGAHFRSYSYFALKKGPSCS